ncbi:hypothetical protein DMC30DRAFT_128778 [Rhodotorula diobovata]|uniref:Uncharacterized protein n=1 Tax=Rhodotorula diobovata TaxID=5288 RepID=A0A5C5G0F7_9BASI|nr:hypothetical protein DMC30DRAFT_128778 [Rhodotorula diobovata]
MVEVAHSRRVEVGLSLAARLDLFPFTRHRPSPLPGPPESWLTSSRAVTLPRPLSRLSTPSRPASRRSRPLLPLPPTARATRHRLRHPPPSTLPSLACTTGLSASRSSATNPPTQGATSQHSCARSTSRSRSRAAQRPARAPTAQRSSPCSKPCAGCSTGCSSECLTGTRATRQCVVGGASSWRSYWASKVTFATTTSAIGAVTRRSSPTVCSLPSTCTSRWSASSSRPPRPSPRRRARRSTRRARRPCRATPSTPCSASSPRR